MTCAPLRPGRSPARDSRGFPRGSGASRARAARKDEFAEIMGGAVVRPGLRVHGLRRDRECLDPSSVGLPHRASICRRIFGDAARRAGVAINRVLAPRFAIKRRACDVERRADRAGDGPGYVRTARTVGPSGGGRGHDAAGDRRAAGTVRTLGRPTPARHPPDHDPSVGGGNERILGRCSGRAPWRCSSSRRSSISWRRLRSSTPASS